MKKSTGGINTDSDRIHTGSALLRSKAMGLSDHDPELAVRILEEALATCAMKYIYHDNLACCRTCEGVLVDGISDIIDGWEIIASGCQDQVPGVTSEDSYTRAIGVK